MAQVTLDYALTNFDEYATTDAFLAQTYEELRKILKDDRLNARSEDGVCMAALRWLHHHSDRSRRVHFVEILKAIKLAQCSAQFLIDLREDDWIKRHDPSRKKVNEAIHQVLLYMTSQYPTLKPTADRRAPFRPPAASTLYVFGGYDGVDSLDTVEKYDALANSFSAVASMPTKRCGFSAVSIGDKIVVIGGRQTMGSRPTSAVDRYDPIGDVWSTLAPMATARASSGVAMLAGLVYAVGGHVANGQLTAAVERYDPLNNTWSTLAPLNERRSECAAVALNGRLYVLGGSATEDDDGLPIDSVISYDPRTDVWSPSVPLPQPRQDFGCAVFQGKIFVAGGWRGYKDDKDEEYPRYSSVICFDPADEQWTNCGDLISTRSELALAVINDRLLALGGFRSQKGHPIVEEFEPATNSWRLLGDLMKEGRALHGVAVV